LHIRGAGSDGEKPVLDKEYVTRQALTLLKFAKSTKDPNVSAALVDKAAALKSRLDETMPPPDLSYHTSGIEPAN
jgi:hypothetical protein